MSCLYYSLFHKRKRVTVHILHNIQCGCSRSNNGHTFHNDTCVQMKIVTYKRVQGCTEHPPTQAFGLVYVDIGVVSMPSRSLYTWFKIVLAWYVSYLMWFMYNLYFNPVTISPVWYTGFCFITFISSTTSTCGGLPLKTGVFTILFHGYKITPNW